jgi:hypothetical protein
MLDQPTLIRIFIGVGVLALIALLYSLYRPATSLVVTHRGPYPLTGQVSVISSAENPRMFLNDSDEAIQLFVYLDGNLRMGQSVANGSAGPSYDTGMYGECTCSSQSDCTNCDHTGYMKLLNIQNTFMLEVLNAPDASRQKSVSTQLYVKTQDNSSYGVETFPLPPLPEQKWTMITISKQGRQLFVYYNSTLVLSKKATHNFSTTLPTCAPVYVGDVTLSGNAAMVTYFSSHQTIQDVASRYQKMTDTRGNLNTMQVVPTSSSYAIVDSTQNGFVKSLCLDGSCFSSGTREIIPVIPPIYNSVETVYA